MSLEKIKNFKEMIQNLEDRPIMLKSLNNLYDFVYTNRSDLGRTVLSIFREEAIKVKKQMKDGDDKYIHIDSWIEKFTSSSNTILSNNAANITTNGKISWVDMIRKK